MSGRECDDLLTSCFGSLCSRLTVSASCPMNLEKFPMDTQRCPLRIGSCKYYLAMLDEDQCKAEYMSSEGQEHNQTACGRDINK